MRSRLGVLLSLAAVGLSLLSVTAAGPTAYAASPRLSLSLGTAPVAQNRAGTANLTPAIVAYRPARAGLPVGIQKLVNGRWTVVANGARQNSRGIAYLQIPRGGVGSFRAYARPTQRGRYIFSPVVTAHGLRLKWRDEFAGTSLDTSKWEYRLQSAGGRRKCSTPASAADRLLTVGSGVAHLKIRKVRRATSACPYGTFKNSMIASTGAQGFEGLRGVYAARVKFQSARGMHGSFWLQGPPVTGAEIDVAEYFGVGRPDSGLASFVHYTNSRGGLSSAGGIRQISGILGGRTPYNSWHVYSVEWTQSRYVFRMDGVPILVTSRPRVSTSPEKMILSLLSSDYELPHLRTTRPEMQVDWVRAWQR